MDGFLFQALIYLCAAVVAVPIANRLGLGSVLGYLLAGIVLGPLIGFVGVEAHSLQQFAEFGVVMMLFLVGLELEPRMLWDMRRRLIGLGGLQVGLSILVLAAFVMLFGQTWRVSLATGLILALSSTAIVIQTLNERGLMKTEGGRASFAILLFQDIAVIPILAVLPLLMDPFAAGPLVAQSGGHGGGAWVAHMPGWGKALMTLGAVGVVVLAGRFVVRPGLRIIAGTRLREMFTAAALLLIVAIAFLMTQVGLSPALGAFLAGVVLADSEFRHELESDIEPFRGLLMGLFFITVGASTNLAVLGQHPWTILGLTAGLVVLKFAVLYALSFRLPPADRWLTSLGLAQGGEFAFVLLSFATASAVLTGGWAQTLSLAVTLSMVLTPGLFILYGRVIQPSFSGNDERDADTIDDQGVAIVAGIGRFGQIIQRMLKASGYSTVVLDHSAEHVDVMRTFGVKTYYGDASRPEILHAAGAHSAKVLVVAIDDQDKAEQLVRHARMEYPHLKIVARAYDRVHYYKLRQAGADNVVREMFGSSTEAAKYTLIAMGVEPARAQRMLTSFRTHDIANLEKLYDAWQAEPDVMKNQDYINRARAATETLAEVLERDAAKD